MSSDHQSISLSDMTPLELITHLFTCMQLADGRMDFEEREVWLETLDDMFPEHHSDHALDIIQQAGKSVLNMSLEERFDYAVKIGKNLTRFYSASELAEKVIPRLLDMAEADGMLLSAETDMLKRLQSELNIDFDLPS